MTKALDNYYENAPVQAFLPAFPPTWNSQCVLMEGIFLINVSPLGTHYTFGDYATFLMKRHLIPHFSRGIFEVHLIFDSPGRLKATPKYFESITCYQIAIVMAGHTCDNFGIATKLPLKWRENVLNCKQCKRKLVCFLTEYFLNNIHPHLSPNQKFYAA